MMHSHGCPLPVFLVCAAVDVGLPLLVHRCAVVERLLSHLLCAAAAAGVFAGPPPVGPPPAGGRRYLPVSSLPCWLRLVIVLQSHDWTRDARVQHAQPLHQRVVHLPQVEI